MGPSPDTLALKEARLPAATVSPTGWLAKATPFITFNTAPRLVVVPAELDTTTS
jgi:hypothetical protein